MNGGRLAELGLAPEVIPLVTLADLLRVPVAFLLDEAIQRELDLVIPWALCRPDMPMAMQSAYQFRGMSGDFPDSYLGVTPAFYVVVTRIKGGSDALYQLLRPGASVEVTSVRDVEALDDLLKGPVTIGLADLLVPWREIVRREWVSKIDPEHDRRKEGAADPTKDERTARRNRAWVTRARKIREKRPDLSHKHGGPKWRPLAQAVLDTIDDPETLHVTTIERALRAHWEDSPR